MDRQDSMSAMSLEQVAETAAGLMPREIVALSPEARSRLGFLAGWPTPVVPNGGRNGLRTDAGREGEMRHLESMPKMIGGWPTPMAGSPETESYNAAGNTDSSRKTVELVGWPTPSAFETTREEGMRPSRAETGRTTGYLAEAVVDYAAPVAGWATPTERDHKHPNAKSFAERGGGKKGEQLANQVAHSGPTPSSSPAETEKRGESRKGRMVLNPLFSLWLMGYRAEWASCGARGIASCRKSRRSL